MTTAQRDMRRTRPREPEPASPTRIAQRRMVQAWDALHNARSALKRAGRVNTRAYSAVCASMRRIAAACERLD